MQASNTSLQFEQASIHSDLNSLNAIRKQGLGDEIGALKKASKEFEAYFLNLMLKSMRQAGEVVGDDSMMGSQQEKMFISMLDEQMSVDLSQKGLLGIADLMMQQLVQKQPKTDDVAQTIARTKTTSTHKAVIHNTVNHITKNRVTENLAVEKLNQEKSPLANSSANQSANLVNQIEVAQKLEKPEKKVLFSKASEFISALQPYAKKAAESLNLDPNVLIAQAALETGWGKFIIHDAKGQPSFNLFGVKAGRFWQGEKVKISTLEVESGKFKPVNASFRKYQNIAESFDDYVNFIQHNSRYENALNAAKDSYQYVKQLQISGYATDPNYANKIISILKGKAFNQLNAGFK